MASFGDALAYQLGSIFFDRPPTTLLTDPRTGYIRAEEARRIALADALMRQLAAMQADPTGGMGVDPTAIAYQEQRLIDRIYNQLAQGGGMLPSGTQKAAAAQALADYHIGLLGQRQKSLQDYISQISQLMRTGGTPYTVTPVEGEESMIKSLAKSFVGGFAGKAMGGI